MKTIRRLPDEVVSQIAAGEVIERPASVLKELIENSLDAQASKIQIETLSAGKKLLRVVDDGVGMPPQDCRLAFERHTTSKISEIDDLNRLSTFGFRGEALFSVAAVSRVNLTSRPQSSQKGWLVRVEGGKIREEHEAPPVSGTSIEVHELFFNTPARAKFLKSDPSERSHLVHVIEEAALANPEVAFTLKSENRKAFQWQANEGEDTAKSYQDRIRDVLGEDLGDGLLAAEETRGDLKIRSFLSPVDRLSPSRNFQFFFINRRPVTSRLLQQALYRAYEPFRSKDRHPVAVVYLEIPPDQFDVNVHPAKREVRFRSERVLFEFLTGVFSGALLRSKGIPTLSGKWESSGKNWVPGVKPSPSWVSEPQTPYASNVAVKTEAPPDFASIEAELSLALDLKSPMQATGISAESSAPRWFTPPFRYVGQIEQSYLVFDAAGGILIVDQHAAQERILFEHWQNEIETGRVRSQKLMLPLPVELPASQVHRILARADRLKKIGFEVEAFGKTTVHVTAAPALFHKASDLKETIHRLLDSLQSEGSAAAETLHHATATIACKAAVKAHDRLSPQEALRLIEDLKNCKDGTCCPHGRPSMLSLNRDELARRFKRPGAPKTA